MYQVSNSFLQAMDDISRTLAVHATIAGVDYPAASIIDFELERGGFDNDIFTIGQTMASALTLNVFTNSTISAGDEVILSIDVLVDGEYTRVPLGVYYVDTISVNQEKMTLTCYDKMVSLDGEYVPSGTFTRLSQLISDIATQTGITFKSPGVDVSIKEPLKGYSYRDTLGFIASLNGGNMLVNRDGQFEIRTYTTVDRTIPPQAQFSLSVKDVYTVSNVQCLFGDVGIQRGDDSGHSLVFENPYMTEDHIDLIYNQLKGLQFAAGTVSYRGDVTLDPGDVFTLEDYKNERYTLLCARNTLTFNGGLSGKLESVGESEATNKYTELKFKNKKDLTSLTIELGKIQSTVQQIEEVNDQLIEQVSDIQQTADEINLKVESKVDENNVVSSINLSKEAVKIKSDRIELTGDTVIIGANGETKTLDEYLTKTELVESENLFPQSNFNDGYGKWTYTVGEFVKPDTTHMRGDSVPMLFTCTGSSSMCAMSMYRTNITEFEIGKTYKVRGWFYVENTNFTPITLTLQGYVNGATTRSDLAVATASVDNLVVGAWTEVELSFTCEKPTTSPYFRVAMTAYGDVWMTDFEMVSLEEVEVKLTQEEILETLNGEGDGLYLLDKKLYINANAIQTGYLSASRIKAGLLQSTNGRLRFSLDGAYISVYDDYGDKVGQTVSNTFTDTTTGATMDGMSSGAEYGNYCALGAKTSSSDTAYTTMVMVSGADNSSIGSNLGGLKKGVNIWNPLTCAWKATFNSNLYANAHAYMTGISNTGYITTTTYLTAGSYIKAGTHMTTPKLSGVTDSSDSRARIEVGADINFKKNSRVQNPSFIEWQGATCFTESGRTGDYFKFYPADSSGTNATNLYLQMANDYVTKFKITCNHWNKGHKSIAEFCYHEGTSTTTPGIDFWRSLSMNGYAIRACAAVSTSSVETANLTLIDDNAQVKVASPAATLSTLDHLEGADLTLTNYLPTATHKSVLHSGSVNVGADRVEWVDLPRQFLMCVDIQITATPNQLCRYAITHKDEYGFVIECDEPNVTFDYVIVGTKMDGSVYSNETNPLHYEPVDKSEPLQDVELVQEIVEDEVGVPIVVPTPQDM